MSHADGDSHMDSSPSSSDSDSMFPTEADPNTPHQHSTQASRFTNLHRSELSPPHSEKQGGEAAGEDVMQTVKTSVTDGDAAQREKEQKAPGWAWNNPKALEEHDRSMEFVLDRNFSMREFGEPFDPTEIRTFLGPRK